jgi:signal transduction histidine kinase
MRKHLPNPNPNLQVRRLVHELNTPLGVSTMVASMLPVQLDGLLAALDAQSQNDMADLVGEWREATALLHSSLQLCVQILNSTRTTSHAPPEEVPLIDLQSTLQSAVAISLARQPAIQVHCQINFAHPVQVHDDLGAWHQVIGNLVANSLMHGFVASGKGAIRITGTLLPGQRVLVHYYDDGAGFSLQAFQQLFEVGFSTRLGTGGTGLGMGIARDLVRHKLGGHMEVHRPAKGVHISIEACC